MAAWPATIPTPAGFDKTLRDPAVRTGDNQFGAKKVRRRMTQAPQDVDLYLIVTAAEKTTFITFYQTTTGHGAEWFTAAWLAYLQAPHHQARIKEWSATMLAIDLWRIDFAIEIRDDGELIDGYLHPWRDVNGV